MPVHPTAIVDPAANISDTADIGPFCVIGADVSIGRHTRLMAHVYMEGPLAIGEENVFYPYSSVGVAPQDLKYKGERSETRIGSRNRIREFVTIHRGTEGGGMITSLGDENLLMAYVHLAHDVRAGSNIVFGHGATIGGHVTVEDWAVISAGSAVHQFCRIGRHSIVGGYTVVTQDVLPFSMTVQDREVRAFGANKTGLERRGFPPESIEALHKAFRLLTKSGLNTSQALERIDAEITGSDEVASLIAFIRSAERGFIK